LKIKTLRQLVASYYVAEAIIATREESIKKEVKDLKKSLPPLKIENERAQMLYRDFAELVSFSPLFVALAKIGLETMELYNFKEQPSITISAVNETKHLEEAFRSTFSSLANINLETHTLNVFEEAINMGKKRGRTMQIAAPMLAALYHDFGKNNGIREIAGVDIGRGYTPHQQVSEIFLLEEIDKKLSRETTFNKSTAIKNIARLVKEHHSENKKINADPAVSFVKRADMMAREKEIERIKSNMN